MFTLLIAIASLASLTTAVCWHPDGLPTPSFGYSLERGPITWAGLAPPPSWNSCRLGRNQSPIVVYSRATPIVPPNKFDVVFANALAGRATLENLGTTLEVPAEPPQQNQVSLGGILSYDGRLFDLQQFHFHTPSEHRFNEEHYPLEMHLVFSTKTDRQLAVISVLFQLVNGVLPRNELLPNVFLNLKSVTRPGTHAPTGPLNMGGLRSALKAGPLYAYSGSLTTPPCTEGVRWLVLGRARPLDVNTYNAVKHVMKFNSRYSQNAPGWINLLEKARQIADGLRPLNETIHSNNDSVTSDGTIDWDEYVRNRDGDAAMAHDLNMQS